MTKTEFAEQLAATISQIRATCRAWEDLAPGTLDIEDDIDMAHSMAFLQAADREIENGTEFDLMFEANLAGPQFNV